MTTTDFPTEDAFIGPIDDATDSIDAVVDPAASGRSTNRLRRFWHGFWRGRPDDPRWVRPAVIGLLLATFGLYAWGLSANNWGNDFYSAAVQAGSTSWKALFFVRAPGRAVSFLPRRSP